MDKTPGAIKQLQRRGLIALRELVNGKGPRSIMSVTPTAQQDGSIQAMLRDSGLEEDADLRRTLEELRGLAQDSAPNRARLAALLTAGASAGRIAHGATPQGPAAPGVASLELRRRAGSAGWEWWSAPRWSVRWALGPAPWLPPARTSAEALATPWCSSSSRPARQRRRRRCPHRQPTFRRIRRLRLLRSNHRSLKRLFRRRHQRRRPKRIRSSNGSSNPSGASGSADSHGAAKSQTPAPGRPSQLPTVPGTGAAPKLPAKPLPAVPTLPAVTAPTVPAKPVPGTP